MKIQSLGPHADDPRDEQRRQFLLRALAAGWLIGESGWSSTAIAGVLGEVPARLAADRSIFTLSGEVWVNGQPADKKTRIGINDQVRTGRNSHVVAVVGADAFMMRGNSELQLGAARNAKRFFRLVSGALLTVFGPRDDGVDLNAPTVTVGIRGTGVYMEVEPDRTYLCTCYGQTLLSAVADANVSETVTAQHHDGRYIYAKPVNGRLIEPAPFINHTDLELMMLESLVGREVPFALGEKDYQGPRRDY
ncbi:MAG: hypothetical protein M3O62_09000 [Pseudomonadota bacterium]|nr:hypothetical protein [Pseudomonadota bacterium]